MVYGYHIYLDRWRLCLLDECYRPFLTQDNRLDIVTNHGGETRRCHCRAGQGETQTRQTNHNPQQSRQPVCFSGVPQGYIRHEAASLRKFTLGTMPALSRSTHSSNVDRSTVLKSRTTNRRGGWFSSTLNRFTIRSGYIVTVIICLPTNANICIKSPT